MPEIDIAQVCAAKTTYNRSMQVCTTKVHTTEVDVRQRKAA